MKAIALASIALASIAPLLGAPAITGGAVDEGYPAVGALDADQGFQCSVVLVGARTALTAAHCLAPGLTGLRVRIAGVSVAVARATPHPRYDPSTGLFDVGVIALEVAPAASPLPVATAAPPLGAPVALVGLGCTDPRPCAGDVTRSASSTIAEVTPDELVLASDGGGHCHGDSGGPLVYGRVVAGLHTSGPVSCRGASRDARLDVVRPWLEEVGGGDVRFAAPVFDDPGCSL